MYCRYCGKEIAEDSSFCKFCGKKVSDEENANSSLTKVGLKERFTRLSKWYQIAIIVYGIWLLVWICVLLGNYRPGYGFVHNYVLSFFLGTIVSPFVIASSIYIYKLLKSSNNHTSMPPIENDKKTKVAHSSLKKHYKKRYPKRQPLFISVAVFWVTSLITLMIYSLIPVYSQEYKWLWPYTNIIPIILQIIPLTISWYIYRKIK